MERVPSRTASRAESAFLWSRSEPEEDISFLPTPGVGDSDGGDIY
jgi:hypothetical protein